MMPLFVDASAWSLAMRRDRPATHPVVERLHQALHTGEDVTATGLVLQEVLQGFPRPASARAIVERFTGVELLVPSRDDHLRAVEIQK